MKELKEHAVYSDVTNNDLILPYKRKYTIKDFDKLIKDGWEPSSARWIILCSAVYWHCEKHKTSEVSKTVVGRGR